MIDILQTVLAFIVALGVLVFVHEYGHFWVARRCGVRVLRFSVGFGQPLFKWTDKQGTEFVIAALPLGGFVKMMGELGTDDVEGHQQHMSFAHKSVFQRFAIVAAGPIINLVFAVFLYWVLFISGVSAIAPFLGDIKPGSLAEQAGFQPMDEIVQVDGVETESWQDVGFALVSRIGETGQVHFRVRPQDATAIESRHIPVDHWMQGQEKENPILLLGMRPYFPEIPAIVGELLPDRAALKGGMKPGDQVLSVNGESIETWQQWLVAIRENPGNALQLVVLRDQGELNLTVTPDAVTSADGKQIGQIGAMLQDGLAQYPDFMMREQQYGPIEAVGKAIGFTWSRITLTVVSLGKMITGIISPIDNLNGPITIAKVAGDSASYGLETFLSFVAYLSITLGVLNLLPIPVLDGGHLMFYLIEMVKGSPVSEKVQAIGNGLGLSLLIMCMGLAFFNDLKGF